METISISLNDDLIKAFGIDAIRKFIEEELAYQKFRLLENRIQESMRNSSFSFEKEYEKAREQAYNEYIEKRKKI